MAADVIFLWVPCRVVQASIGHIATNWPDTLIFASIHW